MGNLALYAPQLTDCVMTALTDTTKIEEVNFVWGGGGENYVYMKRSVKYAN